MGIPNNFTFMTAHCFMSWCSEGAEKLMQIIFYKLRVPQIVWAKDACMGQINAAGSSLGNASVLTPAPLCSSH